MRIIGGNWRGRWIEVPLASGLRPTPDRQRETLFNWLAPFIVGARCLDLFAGSGALGFEALSRGASEVVMVDRDRRVSRMLEHTRTRLQAETAVIVCADAKSWLRDTPGCFDLVFLDPPFDADILASTCVTLAEPGRLSQPAHVYLELESGSPAPPLPPGWQVIRQAKAGRSCALLVRVAPE